MHWESILCKLCCSLAASLAELIGDVLLSVTSKEKMIRLGMAKQILYVFSVTDPYPALPVFDYVPTG